MQVNPKRLRLGPSILIGLRNTGPACNQEPSKGSEYKTTPWYSDPVKKERIEELSRIEQAQQSLAQLALNDPELGFDLFDQFLTSDDPRKKYYASRMATALFRSNELEGNKAIQLLLDDPNFEVRTPVELLLITAPITGTVRDIRDQRLES